MILVGLPYHDMKRHCVDHMHDWVRDADLPDCEVVQRWHMGPWGEKDAVKTHREFFRKLALETGATHLFSLDYDTIPPLDALPKLLAYDAPIVLGTYYGRGEGSGRVPGMGCTLIAREVLEKLSWMDWVIPDDDYPFYDRAKALGYDLTNADDVVCRHYETSELYY